MEIINFRSFGEIVNDLKNVPMLTDENIKPYKNARIRLLEVNPADLNLTALYYIKNKIPFQKELREKLLKEWYDTLKLWWILTFKWDDWQEYSIMPPVVEVVKRECKILPRDWEVKYEKTFDIKFPVLLDGVHRAITALELWLPLQVFYIENVDENCPSYSHPNTWEEIVWCDEVPTNPFDKKNYVLENPKSLYKNFWVLVYSHFRESK